MSNMDFPDQFFLPLFVVLGHMIEHLLLLVTHGLPAVCALLADLCEHNILVGMGPFVCLPTSLDEEGVGRHLALGTTNLGVSARRGTTARHLQKKFSRVNKITFVRIAALVCFELTKEILFTN